MGIDPVIPYGNHSIDDADIAEVVSVLKGSVLTGGPTVARFESALAEAVSAPHVAVCSSGTAALHLAALALGIGSGDRVAVPAITFLATANAPRLCGAEIVFTDVDPNTGLMTGDALSSALERDGGATPVTAVIPVHLNGQVAPLAEIGEVSRDARVKVIEDACHALGTKYQRSTGDWSSVGASADSELTCFSFHPVKTIAMGEGGAVTARDPDLADRVRVLRNHGMERRRERFTNTELAIDGQGQANPWYYEMSELGLNYRASDLHCALGLSQLSKLESFAKRRRELTALYDTRLKGLAPLLRPVARVPGCDPVLHLYAVLIDFAAAGVSRASLMASLAGKGIGTQVHYIPVHMQPYYRSRYGEIDLPGARQYYERCLSLPLFPAMADDDVDRVAAALEDVLLRKAA